MSSSRLALAQAPDVPPLAASTSHELMALEWDGMGAPEGCLSSDSLAAKVEDFLGRAAFDPASPQHLRVSVEATEDGRLRALVTVLDEQGTVLGERELLTEDASCEALEEPLVLAIALLVDGELGTDPERKAEEEPPPEPAPGPPGEESSEDEDEDDPVPVRVVRVTPELPPEPWKLELDASLAGVDGLMPTFGIGAQLSALVDPPWAFPLRARAASWRPERENLSPRGSIDFQAGLAGLMVCPLSERTPSLGVDACFGADVVAQRAESHGLEQARTTTQWFLQGTLALRVLAELPGPWFLSLGAGMGAPFRAPEFVIHSDGQRISVFRSPEGVLLVDLGLGVRVLD